MSGYLRALQLGYKGYKWLRRYNRARKVYRGASAVTKEFLRHPSYAKTVVAGGAIATGTAASKSIMPSRKRKQPKIGFPARKRPRIEAPSKAAPGKGSLNKENLIVTHRRKKFQNPRKRRWKKFVRRVKKAETYADNFINIEEFNDAVLTYNYVAGDVGPQFQEVVATDRATGLPQLLMLGPTGFTTDGPNRMVTDMADEFMNTAGTIIENRLTADQQKYLITMSTLDITIKGNSTASIVVDIYECLAKCDISSNVYQDAFTAWSTSMGNMSLCSNGTGTKPTIFTTGATPYDCSDFHKYWKILSKKRLLLEAGQKQNLQYFGYRGWVSNSSSLNKLAMKGKTKDFILVLNPTYNGDAVAAANAITFEWTKNYHIKIPEMPGVQLNKTGVYTY